MSDIELKVKKASFVLDNDKFEAARKETPPPGKPTEGPHRYTLYVPHDEAARISVGKAHPLNGEDGIAIETQTHIHLTTQSCEEGLWSYLHLGARPVRTGHNVVNQQGDGYAMYTNGASTHTSKQALTITSQEECIRMQSLCYMELTSQEEGITLNAEKNITARATANVDIIAGVEETLEFDDFDKFWGGAFVGVEVFEFFAPLGKLLPKESEEKEAVEAGEAIAKGTSFFQKVTKSRAEEWKEKFIQTHAKNASKFLKHAEATTALVMSFRKVWKKSKKDEAGWTEHAGEWWSWAMDFGTKVAALYSDLVPKEKDENEEGKVRIKATHSVSIDAAKSVSIYATECVSLAGFMNNSMTGVGASIKAYKSASVWGGMGATLKSLAGDVAMTSDFGDANVKGHKGVEVSSAEGGVKVTGEKTVQLNSISENVHVHGLKGVYLGVGKGAGHGMVVTDEKVSIGCLKDAHKFTSAAVERGEEELRLTKDVVLLRNGTDNKIAIEKSGMQVNAAKLTVKTSGNVKINGSVVNIN